MKKNRKLNTWLWKWHVIAGLISLPFVIVLSITGGIYLFKDNYETSAQKSIREASISRERLTYQEQWEIAKKQTDKPLDYLILPTKKNEATRFVSGKFDTSTLYINPYTGLINGVIVDKETDMGKIRDLHGELLMGSYGTKIVELIASWLIVLILTGLYVWWPKGKWGAKGFFTVRTKLGGRTFFRDLHAVTAFWFSLLLFMILLGGLPWTDVFGSSFKWVQETTNSGYPATWSGNSLSSEPNSKDVLALDKMVAAAQSLQLPGEVKISLPQSETAIFSVSNQVGNPKKMEVHHFDQYSGEEIISNNWEDIGVLMQGRLWFMAFHQGKFGPWNKYLMLLVAIALFMLSSAGLTSYLLREKKGWGIPKTPAKFQIGWGILSFIGILAIVLPLFGMSVLFILCIEFINRISKNKQFFSNQTINFKNNGTKK